MNCSTSKSNECTICKLCDKNTSKYTCPRCNIPICSLNCYKNEKHSQCSETFYRECVISELEADGSVNTESKQKMYEILCRLQKEQDLDINNSDEDNSNETDDSDDDENIDLNKRLAEVDLNDADQIWSKLNDNEKQEFEALLKNGQIAQLIPNWIPWWNQITKAKIQDLNQPEDFSYMDYCPKLVDVPSFNMISKNPPSSCVKYNIINVLTSFLYALKMYNGEHFDHITECAYFMVLLSNNLKNGKNYENIKNAVNDVFTEVEKCELLHSDEYNNFDEVKNDLKLILDGPSITDRTYYVKAALSELHKIMTMALKNSSRSEELKSGEFSKRFKDLEPITYKIPKKTLNLYIKKIEYYLSYVNTFNLEVSI